MVCNSFFFFVWFCNVLITVERKQDQRKRPNNAFGGGVVARGVAVGGQLCSRFLVAKKENGPEDFRLLPNALQSTPLTHMTQNQRRRIVGYFL